MHPAIGTEGQLDRSKAGAIVAAGMGHTTIMEAAVGTIEIGEEPFAGTAIARRGLTALTAGIALATDRIVITFYLIIKFKNYFATYIFRMFGVLGFWGHG